MIDSTFWNGKRVFVTGHTGFKGSWLCLWLSHMGAKVYGYSSGVPSQPSLYEQANVGRFLTSHDGDVRNFSELAAALKDADPEVVFHLAAQSLVRSSYEDPLGTYATNVMGTANLLEAVRQTTRARAVVIVTSDKSYLNQEWTWPYRETDTLGGYDPYSNSKACAELVTAAYRTSFFNVTEYGKAHNVGVATARAGNVIGGGDWARDRLIPDCIRALGAHQEIVIRSPDAVRPWQHVLEALSGYLVLAQKLSLDGIQYAEAWNFGPDQSDVRTVEWVVGRVCELWGNSLGYRVDTGSKPHEASLLRLDSSKAKIRLGWSPKWDVERALVTTMEWVTGIDRSEDIAELCFRQIREYA